MYVTKCKEIWKFFQFSATSEFLFKYCAFTPFNAFDNFSCKLVIAFHRTAKKVHFKMYQLNKQISSQSVDPL